MTPAADDTAKGDVFNQMETADDVADDTTPPPALGDLPTAPAQTQAAPAQQQPSPEVEAWFRRAWPALLFVILIAMLANVWLTGGQIGYLSKRVGGGSAQVSEFWASGSRAFRPLFLASLLSLGAVAIGVLAIMLVGGLFAALARVAPSWLIATLSILLLVVAVGALVWLGVRLSFWFVAIVEDRLGPVGGLKAGFRSTRGRWWTLAGLAGVLAAMTYGAVLVFGVVDLAAGALGGAGGMVLGLLNTVLRILVNLYLGFVALGAVIRFYQDVKSTPNASSGASQPATS